jgi:hypothetical protein
MKIQQDELTGKIEYKLEAGENVSIENCLSALIDFIENQAIETGRHTKEYRRLVSRIDQLENEVNNLKHQFKGKEEK